MIIDSVQHEQRRRDLYWALRTRILTPEEMEEVRQRDYLLAVQLGVPFYEKDKREEFNNALLMQYKMREISTPKGS